jgi:hypothetical protein
MKLICQIKFNNYMNHLIKAIRLRSLQFFIKNIFKVMEDL